ncbi:MULTISPECIES: SUMF1/EgtB/PvdO family nonheme iron enzyme [unclassified Duganella]|uniref:SUMF1/EgtB/PvdO family nonheme iron enzyme n=1 Tax=unclassified Duganella TaxID=2636909 RepID=UPI00088052B0|nr:MULTISPECIES: SUMF1/EgtB/PvdO family nonheme iron enzyme [unclassified Duganella]SDF63109.1 Formylglycine-generating enzyme, required for sulfatase activity, contains SUMF1/FGE domain [Duganella sp. OV458]SDI65348.1 Formylglycine-generating enzyme, required for sulfatase activity, contains SUMF1/FGE domain [Duganella sp. OV510]
MQTARDKIRELRALHDDGLLSLQEFDRRKNAILDAEYAPPGGLAAPAQLPQRQGTELGLMTGQEIGPQNRRYRLERLIGMGGMGQVWLATDLATHAELGHSELVALKILPPQLTQSATHAKLLIEEATQARKLAHEHIVRVYEWAQDPATSSYFIIMEYLEGQDLDAYLAEQGTLSLESVYKLLSPIGEALQYAWDKHKLVHRDIKPGNVFLTQRGEVKLLDFGIASRARSAGSSLGLQTPNAGTAGYRAPEAGTHQRQPAPKLDVYAVAVMIYQLLEGRMPFDDMRPADFHPSPPRGLNERQWKVLQEGFAYLQERRPASVNELLAELRRAAGPSEAELAAQAEQAAREQAEREQQRRNEQAAQAEQARQTEEKRKAMVAELAARRQAEMQAAAVDKQKQEQQRRALEAKQRAEAEAAAQARKQVLREQLQARRDADAKQARDEREEQQRKAAQLKAEAAYRQEQERHRKQQAERHAAELAALTANTPVADANGVLRDRFLDGSGAGPDLVLIPTGRFQMGSQEHEQALAIKAGAQKNWLDREQPPHWVGIEYSFAMGRFPVTVGQWRRFVKDTGWESQSDTDWRAPGYAQTDEHPVVGVSWMDAQQYLRWLSDRTGQLYRLPTEAEWEYACRAGTKTAFSFGDTISTEQANYDGHYTYNGGPRGAYLQGTSKVGAFQPNPWGLFDMHGNVWEWTQDVVHDNYTGAPADGSAWEQGGDPVRRVLRGGSWLYNPRYLRSAVRNGFSAVLANDIVGFRVARKLA